MHACPCCGYRTLPERFMNDLCPVCWWEDDGSEPWEMDGPNAQSLIEAQRAYLADARPYRRREGKVRAPKKRESRGPDWQPIEVTDDLIRRTEQAREDNERLWKEEQRRSDQELADNPEGPFQEYNAATASLRERAARIPYPELKDQFAEISRAHGMPWSKAHLELLSRLMSDENYYRRHPIRTGRWLLRYARPGSWKRSWKEVRTGSIYFAA